MNNTLKNITITSLASLAALTLQAQTVRLARLTSPDKSIAIELLNNNHRLSYSVTLDRQTILSPSPLGLSVDGTDLGQDAVLAGKRALSRINEQYNILGHHAVATNRATELCIPLKSSGKLFHLYLRAYNDGVAIRYGLPQGATHIEGEATAWTLPSEAVQVAWTDFSSCYEGYSHVTALSQIPEGQPVMGPLTVQANHCFLSLSEADCETFPDMAFSREGNCVKVNFPFSKDGWQIKRLADNPEGTLDGTYRGEKVSPWRTVIIARSLTALINSDLLTNLCPAPARGSDFSYVKPGRCLWQWWSIGAPQYDDQKSWYDAAARLGWEYYLIDDGWRGWKQEGKDQWQLLKDVIDYGKSIGVETFIWVDSKEFRHAKERMEYLEKVKATGAVGIKIDFIPDATPDIMQWYMGTLHDCAQLKLMLNFHGAVKPTGLSRTYPNNVTREAVRGNEYQMTRYNRVMPFTHDVSLPFSRYMAGAADFTPVILDPAQITTARFTWAHEMAQAIVLLSPITHFTDRYSYYLDSPMFDLFREMPTAWDETIVLPLTEMGKRVGFACRKGSTWWIGIINGEKAANVKLSLKFLKKQGTATLISDNTKGSNTSVERHERNVGPKDVLSVTMPAGGGFVARIK